MKFPENPKIDEKDYTILRLLAADARVSYKEMAKSTGLSAPAVSARFKRLKKEGVVDTTVHVAYEKFGLRIYTLGLSLQTGLLPDTRSKIIQQFANEQRVVSIWVTTGQHDIVLRVVFRNSRELIRFIDEKVRPFGEIQPEIDISEIVEPIIRDCKNVKNGNIKEIPINELVHRA